MQSFLQNRVPTSLRISSQNKATGGESSSLVPIYALLTKHGIKHTKMQTRQLPHVPLPTAKLSGTASCPRQLSLPDV